MHRTRTPHARSTLAAPLLAALAACAAAAPVVIESPPAHPQPADPQPDPNVGAAPYGVPGQDGGALAPFPAQDAAVAMQPAPADAAMGGAVVVTPVPAGPRFPIVAMHLVPAPGASGQDADVDLELRGDGALYSHGQLVGQLRGDRVIAPSGNTILSVSPEGVVFLNGTQTRIRMLENGDIAMPNGSSLVFGDDGTPMSVAPGQGPQQGPSRMLGYTPAARRTAALMAIIVGTVQLPRPRR